MSNYINPDGSGIIGGILPSGATPSTRSSPGQALALDSLGGLIVSLASLGPISNAQGFLSTTGSETLSNATNDTPCSLFNPSNSGKNILITSWIVSSGTGSLIGYMFFVTTDPAYASSLLISNAKSGGAVSAASGTFINTNQSAPSGGTQFRRIYNLYEQELVPNGFGILLPKGSANGVVTQMETYSNGVGSQSIAHLEF
jgi:hypothetical protein